MKPVHITASRFYPYQPPDEEERESFISWRAECIATGRTGTGWTPSQALQALLDAIALDEAREGYAQRALQEAWEKAVRKVCAKHNTRNPPILSNKIAQTRH